MLSALCELATLWAAAVELTAIDQRKKAVVTKSSPFERALASSRSGLLNEPEMARIRDAVLDQWSPALRTRVIVWFVAPVGVLLGLSAAIVAVV